MIDGIVLTIWNYLGPKSFKLGFQQILFMCSAETVGNLLLFLVKIYCRKFELIFCWFIIGLG